VIWLLFGLFLLTLLRLGVAAATPLSPDEAYYWVWSRALAPGYYDHPPMVALWIRAGTALAGETTLGVRLLAPLAAALATLALARAAPALTGRADTAVPAGLLLGATLAFALGAVSQTPDTPLLVFWIGALWALGHVLESGRGAWWLAVGLFVGLALASKLSAVFLAAGIALWLLLPGPRAWLRTPWPWLGGLAALAAFAPVLAWNAAHGWAGLARQGGRLGGFRPEAAAGHLGELIAGQIGMLTPLVFVLALGGLAAAWRLWRATRDPGLALILILTLLPLPVFLQHVLADRVQANWPAVVYPTAILAATLWTGRVTAWLRPAAIGLGGAIAAAVYLHAATAALPLPPRLDPSLKHLAGWEGWARAVEAVRRRGNMAFVVADNYPLAAELAWHLPERVAVLVTEPRWDLTSLPTAAPAPGTHGLLVRSARRRAAFDPAPWRDLIPIDEIVRSRDGVTAENYRLYRITAPDAFARPPHRLPGRAQPRWKDEVPP
jgi:4-amino-4-deoxy-L-arabinose transferase-like glycosyltransferase